MSSASEAFARDGFYVFENVLDAETVRRLSDLTDRILSDQDPQHFADQITTGSMVMIDWEMAHRHKAMAEFIAHRNALRALSELGFDDPRFGHGRIISKPPQSPPLFWHEDGRFWDDPISYTTTPVQVFLMYYLTDTTPENGCLRVIPGSHLKRHRLHDVISERHTDELRKYENPDDPGFSRVADEIDVPVKAGDLVVGFGTLLHASHANRSDTRRTVLTMWYYPAFPDLPEQTQSTIAMFEANTGAVDSENPAVSDLMSPLRITYTGQIEPIPAQWIPGPELK